MYGFKNLLNTFQSFEIRRSFENRFKKQTFTPSKLRQIRINRTDNPTQSVYLRQVSPYKEIYSRSQRKP